MEHELFQLHTIRQAENHTIDDDATSQTPRIRRQEKLVQGLHIRRIIHR